MKETYKIATKFYIFFSFLFITNFSLLTVNCFSQPSITWQRIYESPYQDEADYGNDICQTTDGNFIVSGYSFQLQGQTNFLNVLKINQIGDTIWTKKFFNKGGGLAIVSSNDGGCVVTTQLGVMKLNSVGDTLWDKIYNQDALQVENMQRTTDGAYVACGWAHNDSAYIFKADLSGNLIWQHYYGGNYQKVYYSIRETSDSNYIVAGSDRSVSGIFNSVVAKINMDGKVIWEKYLPLNNIYGSAGYDINILNNGYLLSGVTFDTINYKRTTFIARLDLSGNILFSRFFFTNLNENNFDCKVISSNRYVLTSYIDTAVGYFNYFGLNRIVDSLGNVLYQKLYPTPYGSYFRTVLPINNGDVIFVGTGWFTANNAQDIYLVRTDSLLNSPPPIGIGNWGIQNIPKGLSLFQNYPNPFNNSTKITFDLQKKGIVEIKIYDVLGNLINILINQNKEPGLYEISYNSYNSASGIYFYQLLINGEIIATKKMVLLK